MSSKDIYEAGRYLANRYAAGRWRGLGVTVVTKTGCIAARGLYVPCIAARGLYVPWIKPDLYQGGMKQSQAGCCNG